MLRASVFAILSLAFATELNVAAKIVTFYLYSDTSDWVQGPDTPFTGSNAVLTYTISGWTNIPGANYIWDTYLNSNPDVEQTVKINKKFFVPKTLVSASLQVACDDRAWFYLNGVHLTGCDGCYYSAPIITCDVTQHIQSGVNLLQASISNDPHPGWTPEQNPGGLIYKLSVTVDLNSSTSSGTATSATLTPATETAAVA